MADDKTRFRTAFGAALDEQLQKRSTTQRTLASATGRSPEYINHLVSGRRTASPQWADLVADVLNLSLPERERLHRAAAKDHGFKIDLTKK